MEQVEFAETITLRATEVLDLVARCDEVLDAVEALGALEVAFGVNGLRSFLLGRLMGEPGALED